MRLAIRRHRAYTLIEMIAVMAVFSMVLTLGVTLLTLLFRLDDAARRHTDALQTTARLSRMLRADVGAARGVESVSNKNGVGSDRVTLTLDGDRIVRYEILPRAIKRTVSVGGQQTAVERFRMHRGPARFEVGLADGHSWVVLAFDHHVDPQGDNRPHELSIRAPVGTDHRFERELP